MIIERFPEIQSLSNHEKAALAVEIWDDVCDELGLRKEIADALHKRMAEYRADPTAYTTWEAVKARLSKKQ